MKQICRAVLMTIALALPSFANERVLPPEGVYYHRFVSSPAGPEAVWTNPAFLGQFKVINTEYLGEYYAGRFLNNWGTVVSGDGLGISYRRLENFMGSLYNEYIFALGAELNPGTSWGASYKYIRNGPAPYNKRHFWNIGLLINSSPQLTLGVLFSNLNRGRFEGRRTDFEQIYSFTYKMLKDKISLSADISLSSGQSLSKAEWNYGIEAIAARGLKIYANMDDSRKFQLGFKFNYDKYFVGNQGRYNSDGRHAGSTAYIGYAIQPQASNLREK